MAFTVWGKNETHQKVASNFNFSYIFNKLNLQRCLELTKKKEPKVAESVIKKAMEDIKVGNSFCAKLQRNMQSTNPNCHV